MNTVDCVGWSSDAKELLALLLLDAFIDVCRLLGDVVGVTRWRRPSLGPRRFSSSFRHSEILCSR